MYMYMYVHVHVPVLVHSLMHAQNHWCSMHACILRAKYNVLKYMYRYMYVSYHQPKVTIADFFCKILKAQVHVKIQAR